MQRLTKLVVALAALNALPAQADFNGAYLGLGGSTMASGGYGDTDNVVTSILDGNSAFGFVGYNMQSGNLTFGIEAAIHAETIYELEDGPNAPRFEFNSLHDVKARFGTAQGNVLFYGFAGYSGGQWYHFTSTSLASGMNYGAGVDFLIGDGWFGGIEYIQRDMTTDTPDSDNDVFFDFGAFQLRVGKQF